MNSYQDNRRISVAQVLLNDVNKYPELLKTIITEGGT